MPNKCRVCGTTAVQTSRVSARRKSNGHVCQKCYETNLLSPTVSRRTWVAARKMEKDGVPVEDFVNQRTENIGTKMNIMLCKAFSDNLSDREGVRVQETKSLDKREDKRGEEMAIFKQFIDSFAQVSHGNSNAKVAEVSEQPKPFDEDPALASLRVSEQPKPFDEDPALASLRAELETMKPSQRRKRAIGAGATDEQIDTAEDAQDPLAAYVKLLGSLDQPYCVAEDLLLTELATVKPSQRRKRAMDAGATEDEIDEAVDADNPIVAFARLIVKYEQVEDTQKGTLEGAFEPAPEEPAPEQPAPAQPTLEPTSQELTTNPLSTVLVAEVESTPCEPAFQPGHKEPTIVTTSDPVSDVEDPNTENEIHEEKPPPSSPTNDACWSLVVADDSSAEIIANSSAEKIAVEVSTARTETRDLCRILEAKGVYKFSSSSGLIAITSMAELIAICSERDDQVARFLNITPYSTVLASLAARGFQQNLYQQNYVVIAGTGDAGPHLHVASFGFIQRNIEDRRGDSPWDYYTNKVLLCLTTNLLIDQGGVEHLQFKVRITSESTSRNILNCNVAAPVQRDSARAPDRFQFMCCCYAAMIQVSDAYGFQKITGFTQNVMDNVGNDMKKFFDTCKPSTKARALAKMKAKAKFR